MLRTRLENFARKAKEHLEDRYRAWRGSSPPAPVTPAETVAPAEPPAPPKQIRWELRSQAELVNHIEQHFHAGLRRDLPLLIDAARAVERAHAAHASVPAGLADHLEELFAQLDSHMLKEEQILFPTLRTGARGGPIDMPIRMMEREHDDHDAGLATIRTLTADLVAPPDAPPAWQNLYAGLSTLETDLRQHIYLENNVLFARALGGEY
ncbi:MAG TPA: hemerythrin domain-containing protein [Kofleriaceae bacterium]|nr:hemerythrin domain-containing protein [Kofleriaceae bacterium]